MLTDNGTIYAKLLQIKIIEQKRVYLNRDMHIFMHIFLTVVSGWLLWPRILWTVALKLSDGVSVCKYLKLSTAHDY